MSPRLPRNVWIVTITSFLNDISSDMILNLLPLFLANVLGVRTGVIGLIEGSAESLSSLIKIASGWFSDRLGSRKWLAVLGYAISTLTKPLLYFAGSWATVLGVRSADRIGKGIRAAPRDALIADSIDEKQRGRAFGLHRAGDTAGALTGILIALGVVWASQAGALKITQQTFQRLVLVSVIPAGLAVLVLAVGAQDTSRSPDKGLQPLAANTPPGDVEAKTTALNPERLLKLDRTFRRFLVVIVIFTLGNSADAFLILRAQERGLGVLGILGMLATFNLIYALISTPAGALSDRIGRQTLITGGWLVYALIYLGFALAESAWQIGLLYACYGIYYGVVEGTAKAFVADLVSVEQRGTAYGFYNAAVGFSVLPASLIAGVLWQGIGNWSGFGARAPFLFGAGLALLAVILLRGWGCR